ncbi:MAG: hypothetical protein QOJ99_1394 [Bryobacterales bacterium]|jgi:hypothetical protein|nr:hypothetical protein [Bryobacterales bacterium]
MSPATPLSQISEAQLEANRQNAQKSTGPRTEEGKKRSRINATRHGLTGQFHAFSHEDKIAFDEHCTNLMADFKPETYREKLLAMSIAEDMWRLNRARALENNIFAIGMSGPIGDATDVDSAEGHAAACQARVWLADGRNIQLLAVYETRIRRNIEKNEKQLKELETERKAAHDKILQEEILLAKLALSEGVPYECPTYPGGSTPGETTGRNGFEFSTGQITRLARRELRLEQATRRQNTMKKAA